MQCFAKISRNESIELRDFSRVLFGRRCDSKERQRNAHVCVSSSDAASASYAGLKPEKWRLRPESNRCTRICNPLHSHSATQPFCLLHNPVTQAVSSTPGTIPDAETLTNNPVKKPPTRLIYSSESSESGTFARNKKPRASRGFLLYLERETRFELATPTLARLCSTS